MKKLFTIFICLLCLICLVGCGEKEPEEFKDLIEVEFKINNNSYFKSIEKGSVVNTDMIPLDNNISYALYYDENYEILYNEEKLVSNTVLYAKELNGSIQIGDFYTLGAAYENGYLSKEDIESIKNKYTSQSSKEEIGENKLNIIKNDYLHDINEFLDLEEGQTSIKDISLIKFYGIYNGYYIIRLLEDNVNDPSILTKINIDNIEFEYKGPDIFVWSEEQGAFPNIFFYKEAEKHYDINDEKMIDLISYENMTGNSIIVMLKKTYTYPELNVKCFGIEKATHLKYLNGIKPSGSFDKDKYRQLVCIYTEAMSEEEVRECIEKLQRLSFVKNAYPNRYVTVD